MMAKPFASVWTGLTSALPYFSIIVSLLAIVGQLAIIGLILISPTSLDLLEIIYSQGTFNGTVLLNSQQTTSLGIATLVIIIEGIFFGSLLTYQKIKKSVFAAYCIHPAATDTSHLTKSPSLQDSIDNNAFIDRQSGIPSGFSVWTYFQLHSDSKTLVKKLVVLFFTDLAIEVVQFLTKWILALLVIRGNWVSVGVTIVAGVHYPFIQFWKSFLAAEEMKTIKPVVRYVS